MVVSNRVIFIFIRYFLFMLTICFSFRLVAEEQSSYGRARYILDEIGKFQKANAPRAYAILQRHRALELQLSLIEQLEWNFTVVVISNNLDDMTLAVTGLERLHELSQQIDLGRLKVTYLMYLGHHFIKSSYQEKAIIAYACAIPLVEDARKLFPLLYSLGVAYKSNGQIDKGDTIFTWLDAYADNIGNLTWKALVSEALGISALERDEYQVASVHFREAMDIHQKNADRRSEFNSSVNLLLSFALAKNFERFDRLEGRVLRLSRASNNKDLHIYLEWIQATAALLRKEAVPAFTLTFLYKRLSQVQSQLIVQAIQKNLARHLPIAVTIKDYKQNSVDINPTVLQPNLFYTLADAGCNPSPNIQKLLHNAKIRVAQE